MNLQRLAKRFATNFREFTKLERRPLRYGEVIFVLRKPGPHA